MDYVDQDGTGTLNISRKRRMRIAEVGVAVKAGTHIAPSKSVTLKRRKAGEIVPKIMHQMARSKASVYRALGADKAARANRAYIDAT